MATPERYGACRGLTSALVTADQRMALRKAESRSGGSNRSGVTSGSVPLGKIRRPGSISQMTSRVSLYRPSSTLCRVTSVLLPEASTSLTTHLWPRTATRSPMAGSCDVIVTAHSSSTGLSADPTAQPGTAPRGNEARAEPPGRSTQLPSMESMAHAVNALTIYRFIAIVSLVHIYLAMLATFASH